MMDGEAVQAVFLGGGGHARAVLDAARLSGSPHCFGLVERDASMQGRHVAGVEILGGDEVLPELARLGVTHFVVAVGSVGDAGIRIRLFERARGIGLVAARVIHPSAVIAASARIGVGTVVLASVVVNPDAVVGENVILNTASVIEHDCQIAAHVHVAPRVVLGGAVQVGEGAHIGMGAVVLPGVRVGARAIVGAGAVVLKDVEEGSVMVGNPARSVTGPR